MYRVRVIGEQGRSVEEIVLEKLKSGNVPDQVANLVINAMCGSGEFNSAPHEPPARQAGEPPSAYLKAITVEGFRGIGPKVTLRLQPGPGLTLVTGRNGSGKSSLAEAAELALTGQNRRWADRAAVWKEGWRNLHKPGSPAIAVEMTEDGQPGAATVAVRWAPGADLEDADVFFAPGDGPPQPLADKGWTKSLELYRPFLSYSELGALVSGQPSKMHDALQAILGLDLLIDTERSLTDSRKSAESVSKAARQELPGLLEKLARHPDQRARAAEQALAGRVPDLDALAALASGAADDERDGRIGLLQQVAAITLPDKEAFAVAVERLEAARAAVVALAGTVAADARQRASLLSAALEHRREHADEPCPVCGGRVLDNEWAAGAAASVEHLNSQAAEADAAYAEEADALKALGLLVPSKPAVLSADLGKEADPAAASAAWDEWSLPSPTTAMYESLITPLAELQERAAAALRRRAQAWQPIANDLAAWVWQWRESQQAAARLADLKKALDWLRKVGKEIRNERLAPFAETSARVWEMLRQESNVELGPITLEGSGPQRKVALDVTIDGVKGAALSVMSQGELHALGLALFLPRATAAESPFGFLVIDDPVQSMDPAKVDGLARVLSYVAQTRQVLVFTHDDRLRSAVHQLQLPATVWAVTRRERSVVAVKKADDPVERYLDDARAMARTQQLPADVRAVAVAGLCRGALEAACFEVIRTRQLAAGVPHREVELALESAHTLHHVMALALFGSATRGGEVLDKLRALGGPAFVNVFRDCKKGVHETLKGDMRRFVEDAGALAKAIRR
jgi:recombinational DNA repair ATPase RecF